ncbi:hypothetical protein JYB88_17920 [Shewanella cyperi]|uniref:Periplasmic protein n=1 Tax=Shewanella cyperi TaxID=2814292 RepID=A0A974XMY9_9GAMM|nr:hypothetical protein [Shewanella cyperi]QSX30026.1 hypothetical protein JYB88_17920 [Shewanella cyperi]
MSAINRYRLWAGLLLFSVGALGADVLNNQYLPPKDAVLDDKGQPLAVPESRPALEIHLPQATQAPKRQSGKVKQSKKISKKTISKTKVERQLVANDPACRWLDARLDHLEAAVRSQGAGYQKEELTVRRKEWSCLDCGGHGPEPDDYGRCQYRR